ncbi:MAG: hypothetical protein R3C53_25435 [Pirellulaceae bacterium]
MAILNTLAVSLICLAIAIPISAGLAILLVRTNIIGRRWCWLALGSQLAVPLYVFAGGWSAGFGLQGWLVAGWLGPSAVMAMQSAVANLFAVSLIHALAAIPWVCLILSLGLIWTDRGQEEMALLEGGSRAAIFRVVLPKLRPWLLASCVWCIVPIFTEMVVTNLYQVPTIAEQIYLDASFGTISPLTYIASVVLSALPVFGLAAMMLRSSPNLHDVLMRAQHFQPRVYGLRQRRLLLSMVVWFVLLILVGLPIVNLTYKAGWQPRLTSEGSVHYGWSLTRFCTTVVESFSAHGAEFYWTGLLAITSGLLAMGLALAIYFASGERQRRWIHFVMLILLAIPGPLAGMLVIGLLNRDSPAFLGRLYDTTLTAPLLAQQFRQLPLAWLLVNAVFAAISNSTWGMVRSDGLNHFQALRYVVWPQCGRRLFACFILLVATSAGELSSTILVLPNGVTTVSKKLFEFLHFGMRHQDSGLCGVLLLIGCGVSLLFWKTLSER